MENSLFAGLIKTALDFYIIRHGESMGNTANLLQGRGEYPLSERGRLQASARASYLKKEFSENFSAGIPPEKILLFSSPLLRAMETAGIFAREVGLPEPLLMDDLVERDLGVWSGKSFEQVKSEYPSVWADFQARGWDAIPKAESFAALYERAQRVWPALCNAATAHGAEKVIVVTHEGFGQVLLKSTFNCRSWFPLFSIFNCGLSKLHAEPGQWEDGVILNWDEINSTI